MADDKVFIPRDSLVKVFFKNGTVIEGMVLSWSDKKGLLRSPGSTNRLIVYNPAENVMMVKLIIPEPEIKLSESEEPVQPTVTVNRIQPSFQQEPTPLKTVPAEPISDRTKRLVQYKMSQASSERKHISNMFRSSPSPKHQAMDFSNQPPKVETEYYESPDFTKRRTIFSSRKKSH